MTAYSPSEWTDFFVACASAAAALSGLVFVAISINVDRIVKYEGLADRALETIMLLVGALVASVISLVPGQSTDALGIELLVVAGLFLVTIVTLISRGVNPAKAPRGWLISRVGVSVLGSLPIVIGGLSLIVGSGGGLYWVFAGIVAAIVGGVLNAWVLLVEILR
jgi:modulator of FtsH protease